MNPNRPRGAGARDVRAGRTGAGGPADGTGSGRHGPAVRALQRAREATPPAWVRVSRDRAEAFVALAAFAVLCLVVLSAAARLVEPDDYAYRASIVAITQGHFLTLSTAQADRLAAQLPGPVAGAPGVLQWVQLPGGRWISEKDPGYPFLAAPFQAAGIIRLAPLFYGALAAWACSSGPGAGWAATGSR